MLIPAVTIIHKDSLHRREIELDRRIVLGVALLDVLISWVAVILVRLLVIRC